MADDLPELTWLDVLLEQYGEGKIHSGGMVNDFIKIIQEAHARGRDFLEAVIQTKRDLFELLKLRTKPFNEEEIACLSLYDTATVGAYAVGQIEMDPADIELKNVCVRLGMDEVFPISQLLEGCSKGIEGPLHAENPSGKKGRPPDIRC